MFKNIILAAGASAMLFTAVPAVQAQTARDRAYCEDVAYRASYRKRSNNDAIGTGAVGGAIAGGVIGGLLGKGKGKNIVGGAIAGTAAGAVLGATAGSRGGSVNRRVYRATYDDCIDERLDLRRPVRVYRDAGADEVEYCLSRYRSYNPRTGLYRTYSGELRPCP